MTSGQRKRMTVSFLAASNRRSKLQARGPEDSGARVFLSSMQQFLVLVVAFHSESLCAYNMPIRNLDSAFLTVKQITQNSYGLAVERYRQLRAENNSLAKLHRCGTILLPLGERTTVRMNFLRVIESVNKNFSSN